jgi:hypothetical protein
MGRRGVITVLIGAAMTVGSVLFAGLEYYDLLARMPSMISRHITPLWTLSVAGAGLLLILGVLIEARHSQTPAPLKSPTADGRTVGFSAVDRLRLSEELDREIRAELTLDHMRAMGRPVVINEPARVDTALHLFVNDPYTDAKHAFAFENFGDDSAFSAAGMVGVADNVFLEFKAEREITRGRREGVRVYLVRSGAREFVDGFSLVSVLRRVDEEIGNAEADLQRQVFGAAGVGTAKFNVSTEFVDKYHVKHRRAASHKLIFNRSERELTQACRFEPIPTRA